MRESNLNRQIRSRLLDYYLTSSDIGLLGDDSYVGSSDKKRESNNPSRLTSP